MVTDNNTSAWYEHESRVDKETRGRPTINDNHVIESQCSPVPSNNSDPAKSFLPRRRPSCAFPDGLRSQPTEAVLTEVGALDVTHEPPNIDQAGLTRHWVLPNAARPERNIRCYIVVSLAASTKQTLLSRATLIRINPYAC